MTVDEIRELIQLASETGVAELEVQRGENRVRIRRSMKGSSSQEFVLLPQSQANYASTPAPAPASTTAPAPTPAIETAKDGKGNDPTLVLVKSPIVGTFYESASPDAPPFVRMGERVQPGKVLCIIESMKLMNEIECETSGIIESKLVMNGQPVEYGEALFAVRCV
jgi:acetyl-CoA carboxylase biotin carboxyl carrier protein